MHVQPVYRFPTLSKDMSNSCYVRLAMSISLRFSTLCATLHRHHHVQFPKYFSALCPITQSDRHVVSTPHPDQVFTLQARRINRAISGRATKHLETKRFNPHLASCPSLRVVFTVLPHVECILLMHEKSLLLYIFASSWREPNNFCESA